MTNPQSIPHPFSDYAHPTTPGGVLAILRHNRLLHTHCFGMANLDHAIPNSPDTAFNIGSEAKQFTAACIALLLEENALRLDDDIHRFFPAVPTFGHRITLDHLIHHTSGIPDYHTRFTDSGAFENIWPQSALIDYALHYPQLDFPPGDRCNYSNTGYLLLAAVVQHITGMPFSQFAREKIFQPLGMHHTLIHDDRRMIVPNRAFAYRREPDGHWSMDLASNETVPGDGKMFSTVHDLALWDANFYEPRIGHGRFPQIMRQHQRLNDGTDCPYAFGLDHGQFGPAQCAGHAVETHGGGHAGFHSVILRLPDARLTVILLNNTRDPRFRPAALSVAQLALRGSS